MKLRKAGLGSVKLLLLLTFSPQPWNNLDLDSDVRMPEASGSGCGDTANQIFLLEFGLRTDGERIQKI
jgi:hypothetical protein